jgi:fatty acid desaturase
LGTPQDPDLEFYRYYPLPKKTTLQKLLLASVNGQVVLDFLEYYNGLRWPWSKGRNYKVQGPSDQIKLLLFWLIVVGFLWWQNYFLFGILFWIVPLILWLPWLLFKVSLEHAPLKVSDTSIGKSRTIVTNLWIEKLLFPIHINYHSEHHLFPWIPHYRLPEVSRQLAQLEKQSEYHFLHLRQMNLRTGISQLWITEVKGERRSLKTS